MVFFFEAGDNISPENLKSISRRFEIIHNLIEHHISRIEHIVQTNYSLEELIIMSNPDYEPRTVEYEAKYEGFVGAFRLR